MTAQPSAFARETNRPPWWLTLIWGVLLIIIGILLLTQPRATMTVLVQILGIYFLVSGAFSLISLIWDRKAWGWKIVVGILGIIAGLLVLGSPLLSSVLVPTVLVLILAIQAIIAGIMMLIMAFSGGGWGMGILGGVSIVLGVILLFNPLVAGLGLPFVLGIFAIIGGVLTIISAFRDR